MMPDTSAAAEHFSEQADAALDRWKQLSVIASDLADIDVDLAEPIAHAARAAAVEADMYHRLAIRVMS